MNNPVVITGVTGSIGGAAAKELAKSGRNDLILVGRNESKLQKFKIVNKSLVWDDGGACYVHVPCTSNNISTILILNFCV